MAWEAPFWTQSSRPPAPLASGACTWSLGHSNHAAARLYESRGFELVGVRPDYYEKPTEDARVLAKTLSDR